jgi:hypothetical protein
MENAASAILALLTHCTYDDEAAVTLRDQYNKAGVTVLDIFSPFMLRPAGWESDG